MTNSHSPSTAVHVHDHAPSLLRVCQLLGDVNTEPAFSRFARVYRVLEEMLVGSEDERETDKVDEIPEKNTDFQSHKSVMSYKGYKKPKAYGS